jgi:pilus assembly protein CpaF
LFLTLSSGVKGFTTIHAGPARQALTRLRFICQLADTTSSIPMSALNTLVSEAIDVVVQCNRTRDGLRVTEIACVEDLAGGPEATQFTVTRLLELDTDGVLGWTGNLPVRATRALRDAGHEVRDLLTGDRLPVP